MPVRFLITTLKPGVDPEKYERWVREYDYNIAKSRENIISYKVHRIKGPIQGLEDAGWSYLERIEVKSIAQHDIDAKSESGQELRRQLFGEYVDQRVFFDSDVIE